MKNSRNIITESFKRTAFMRDSRCDEDAAGL
jgi:hypothetical protein